MHKDACVIDQHEVKCQDMPSNDRRNINEKLSYRRETARQLPSWRGLSPPVHSPSPLATPMRTIESETRNAKRAVRNPQRQACRP